jgi:hypothetical protein
MYKRRRVDCGFEQMEDRRMMTGISLSDGDLIIDGSNNDDQVVVENGTGLSYRFVNDRLQFVRLQSARGWTNFRAQ